ncbi:DMT family transporter [Candidatus Methylospira mobilis]|uniref:DMT family transporter n=1 Tax=Candidatus Methylospira mobilis TaxID=1808979 RepID=A0A5Q0BGY9_9GAMM|nr:DMT family transporter [Candidatus Methylospira mobilis]QFY43093.1 DMT family transporter [Candidatus Methylospira mobilis]
MKRLYGIREPGVIAALTAAFLFGAGTPLAKRLLLSVDPWLLAGLLYLGSGLGLSVYLCIRGGLRVKLSGSEWLWFTGGIGAGGIAAPVLLLWGLNRMPAAGASLLLNAEGVFTALLAWFVFRENFDRRLVLGMLFIVAGAAVLSWPEDQARFDSLPPVLLILTACLAWGLDNNFTRHVAHADAAWIAAVKGMVAGTANLGLAFSQGATWPPALEMGAALTLGLCAYGVSLVLFVVGLRRLGTARTGAYFSVAPFFGAVLAVVVLGETITLQLLAAGMLMVLGVLLHLSEQHSHLHRHEAMTHEHEHVHDEHHLHGHVQPVPSGVKHSHLHDHTPLNHSHRHFPDAHHRHDH